MTFQVHHGNLVFSVGTVEYLPPGVPLALIVGCAAGGVLLLLFMLIMAVCIASYRKNHNNERMFKELEGQRDALELTVAQECKEGGFKALLPFYIWRRKSLRQIIDRLY